jgi:hemolysin activation/secretion protein
MTPQSSSKSFSLNLFASHIALAMGLSIGSTLVVHAQTTPQDIQTDELRRAQERARQVQEQQPQAPDVRLERQGQGKAAKVLLPLTESPSFLIKRIELVGDSAGKFEFALSKALTQTGLMAIETAAGERIIVTQANYRVKGQPDNLTEGVPLGANGVNVLMTAAQNAIIDRGYTTTRILAEPQDLKSGTLQLTVIPGRVRHISFDQTNADKTNVFRARSFNALPIKAGDILNLRDIEMGLENFKRVPTVEADIKIAPADKPNESDLIITWAQKTVPLRANLTFDDTGGRSTGKYQGGATLSIDHPLTLNDLFYVSYGRDLSGHDKVSGTDEFGNATGSRHGSSNNWNVHYSVPYGYWQAAFNASGYYYEQAVAGANQTYTYSGHSRTQDLKLSKMVYRDAQRKITAYIKGWARYSDNYIDDTEIEVQRRKTAGLEFGISHREHIGNATLDIGLAYKRGTGAKDALRAPEELFGEGTSRMKIITADVGFSLPFKIKNASFNLSTNNHIQWNKTPLTPQDRIAIGGRSTVRGFDGKMTLAAERGWYSRNELAWTYAQGHQLYTAIDAGHVSGPSAEWLLGQTMVGGAIGVRGQVKLGGDLQYDLFAATPIHKPDYFNTAKTTFGFSLSYAF